MQQTTDKTFPWVLQVDWLENVGFTPEDSGERGEYHEFTSQQALDEFLFLYRLQHDCVDGEADDWLVRGITIYSPQQLHEREVERLAEQQLIEENGGIVELERRIRKILTKDE